MQIEFTETLPPWTLSTRWQAGATEAHPRTEKGLVSVFILKDDRKEFYKYIYDPFLIDKTLEILRPIKEGQSKNPQFLELNNKYFKAVKRGMGEKDSKETWTASQDWHSRI